MMTAHRIEVAPESLSRSQIASVLADAARSLDRTAGYLRPMISATAYVPRTLLYELDRLRRQQLALEGALYGSDDANLGSILLALGIGGAGILSALGIWSWKQHRETAAVEEKSRQFDKLIEANVDPTAAARRVYGGSDITAGIGKLVWLAVILGGLYVFTKIYK